MSVPRCSGAQPAAAAAAAPALDPPGVRDRSHGLRARAWKLDSPDDSMPRSGIVVLASRIAPASRSRAAGGASAAAGTSSVAAQPSGTGTPRVATFSFTVSGTPSRAPSGRPSRQRRSEACAASSAPSRSSAQRACRCGSQRSMRASTASTAATGDSLPSR